MTAVGETRGTDVRPGRWQIRLSDLTLWVLAAGLAAGVARGAKEAWGTRTVGPGTNPVVPWERTAGVFFEVMAVFLVSILAKSILGLLRDPRPVEQGRGPARLWPIAWRFAAVALLLTLVIEQSNILRVNFMTESWLGELTPGWGTIYRLWQGLLPICGFLAIIGVSLGTGAGVLFEDTKPGRPRPYWLMVPLAGVVGLLMAANWWSLIPYLVLLAIDAVYKAMSHNLVMMPSFGTRLLRAGIDVSFAAIPCLVLAMVVARDFDRARRDQPWATTRPGCLVRVLALLGAVGAATYLIRVTIPAIHPWLAEGFALIIGPGEVSLVLIGFGIFSLGLAARTIFHRPAIEKPRWMIRLAVVLRFGLLGILLLSVFKAFPTSSRFDRRGIGAPPIFDPLLDAFDAVHGWSWGRLPDRLVMVLSPALEPETMLWMMMMVGLTLLVFELALRPTSAGIAPLDSAIDSPGVAARLTWLALALTVVCMVALPTFMIGSQALVHLRLNYADWVANGWPPLR